MAEFISSLKGIAIGKLSVYILRFSALKRSRRWHRQMLGRTLRVSTNPIVKYFLLLEMQARHLDISLDLCT